MSSAERSKRIMDLFDEIYDLDEDARNMKLETLAQEDPALANELKQLLKARADANKERFLDTLDGPPVLANPPAIGQQINAFEIEAVLASGGMGTVYRARHVHLDRPIALKIPHLFHPNREQLFARIQREGKALARLDHPNIVKVYDAGITEDGTPFIAMAYLDGENLASRRAHGPVSEDEAIKWGIQLAQALDYLHHQDIIHRDIKTANILLDADNNAILADFGIAYVEDMSRMTGHLPGTPAYMCPEQIRGRSIDGRCDLYSLGLVMHEMLAGFHPDDRPLRDIRPDVSEKLIEIIEKCTQQNPGFRFQSGAALAEALDFKKAASNPATKQPASRKPLVLMLSALTLVAITIFAVFSFELFPGPNVAATNPPADNPSTTIPAQTSDTPLIESIIQAEESLPDLKSRLTGHMLEGTLTSGEASQFTTPENCYIFVYEDEGAPPVAILEPGAESRRNLLNRQTITDVPAFLQGKSTVWVYIYN